MLKHVRLGALAVGLGLGALSSGGAAAERAEPVTGPAPALTYVTLNVLHGGVLSGLTGRDQDLERRLEIVAEELAALRPDIVGLQEASTSRRRGNVAERLAARLGFEFAYAPALFRFSRAEWNNRIISALMNFTEGPAILSRFPIVRSEAHDLPRCGQYFDPRVLLHAEVATPWGRLSVFSTHVSGHPCHTRAVAHLVRERRGELPAVLLGDFNAVEGSATIDALTDGAGLLDVFRAANPTAPGPTVWQRIDAPEATVRRRVDFLFLLPGRNVRGRVLRSRVVLDHPRPLPDGGVLWPSDHHGVLAEIAVFPSPGPAGVEDDPGEDPSAPVDSSRPQVSTPSP